MGKSKSYTREIILIIILAAVIAGLLIYMNHRSNLNFNISLSPDMTLADNALMGFAPDASNLRLCQDSKLVFLELTWAEWEPEDGVFDIRGFEERNNIDKWKKEKKHAVLRFVCDVPGKTRHTDIPKWMFDKTGSGTFYDNSLGKGYSPDYSDEIFIKYHERALKRLAEYCNSDYFVSFVEVGSLGHNGSWNAQDAKGKSLMPDSLVCLNYAAKYTDNFINARLLAGRNYEFATEGSLGFYNDLLGDTKATNQWLKDLQNDGEQETQAGSINLTAVDSIGKKTPVGGDFTADIPMNKIIGEGLGDVLSDVSASNMTFIGPHVPDYKSENYALESESILRRMGYRIYVSRLKGQYNFAGNVINLEVSLRNAGSAGFYFDWPVTVYIYDADKKLVFWEGLSINLMDLSADEDVTALSKVPYASEIRDEFYVGIKITDYTAKESVELAIDTDSEKEYVGDVLLIYHYVR